MPGRSHGPLAAAPLPGHIQQVVIDIFRGVGIEAVPGAGGVALVAQNQPLVFRHTAEDRPRGLLRRLRTRRGSHASDQMAVAVVPGVAEVRRMFSSQSS